MRDSCLTIGAFCFWQSRVSARRAIQLVALVAILAALCWASELGAQSERHYPSWFGTESRQTFERMTEGLHDLELAQALLVYARVSGTASPDGTVAEVLAPSPDTAQALGGIDAIQQAVIRNHAVGMVGRPDLSRQEREFWESLLDGTFRSPNASSYGEPHIVTFDGLRYDFQAAGEFIAARSTVDEFEVQVRQEPRGTSQKISVNTAIAMNIAGTRVGIYALEDPPLRINDRQLARYYRSIRLPGGGVLFQEGKRFLVLWPDQSSMTVIVSQGSHIDYYLSVSEKRKGKLQGLLGNWDGTKDSDLITRDGRTAIQLPSLAPDQHYAALYDSFGQSWRISQQESLFSYAPKKSTKAFTIVPYPAELSSLASLDPEAAAKARSVCRAQGLIDSSIFDACVFDVAMTSDNVFAEGAAVAARTAAVDRRSTYTDGVDRPGLDYQSFDLDEPQPEVCQASCISDLGCSAWTYVKPGVQGSKARCWLKYGVPDSTVASCCTSGRIEQRVALSCDEYALVAVKQEAINRAGKCGIIGLMWHSDQDAHLQWCRESPSMRIPARTISDRHQTLLKCSAR